MQLCSFNFGIGALLAPQLVHFMEVWTHSGTGVFYVAFALASTMAIATMLLPKGAVAPVLVSMASQSSETTLGGDLQVRDETSNQAPSLTPIIWDEADEDYDNDGGVGHLLGNREGPCRKGGKWRLAFQAALLLLIFSNVSIELGESQTLINNY